MDSLNARLDAITCHLEALSASIGTLRLNLAGLNRTLVRAGALDRADRGAVDRETTVREADPRQAPCRGAECQQGGCREALDRELSRLRQQVAAFRFESHQEHQELYRAGRDSVVQALIEGRGSAERTWSAEAPAADGSGYPSAGAELLTRERSFTVPLCEGT